MKTKDIWKSEIIPTVKILVVVVLFYKPQRNPFYCSLPLPLFVAYEMYWEIYLSIYSFYTVAWLVQELQCM